MRHLPAGDDVLPPLPSVAGRDQLGAAVIDEAHNSKTGQPPASCAVLTLETEDELEMLANIRDKQAATRLLKDRKAMTRYARLVYKLLITDLSKDGLLGVS